MSAVQPPRVHFLPFHPVQVVNATALMGTYITAARMDITVSTRTPVAKVRYRREKGVVRSYFELAGGRPRSLGVTVRDFKRDRREPR